MLQEQTPAEEKESLLEQKASLIKETLENAGQWLDVKSDAQLAILKARDQAQSGLYALAIRCCSYSYTNEYCVNYQFYKIRREHRFQ